MKPFYFPLQAVQTLRQRQEQVALEQYGQAIQLRQLAREQLKLIEQELEAVWDAFKRNVTQCVSAGELNQAQAYCRSVEQRYEQGAVVLENAGEQVSAAWQALIETRRQREIIDKYQQSMRRSYERELMRHEQALTDEMANRGGGLMTIWKPGQQSSFN
jgi:flagellar export protein FliJ